LVGDRAIGRSALRSHQARPPAEEADDKQKRGNAARPHYSPPDADAIALVCQHLWPPTHCYMSPATADLVEIPCSLLKRLTKTLWYAA
jgi:hypothetical protein